MDGSELLVVLCVAGDLDLTLSLFRDFSIEAACSVGDRFASVCRLAEIFDGFANAITGDALKEVIDPDDIFQGVRITEAVDISSKLIELIVERGNLLDLVAHHFEKLRQLGEVVFLGNGVGSYIGNFPLSLQW